MVIIGWLTHSNFLKSVVPGAVTMKFNAALGFVCSSCVLMLHYFPGKNKIRYNISVVLSVVVSLIGLLTLLEYLFGINLLIDELFVKDRPHPIAFYAGRMAPLSAINFLLIGIGLLLLNQHKTATYQFFYLTAIFFTSALLLVSFNFITEISTFMHLSIYAATGFITLTAAIYFAQPILGKKITFEHKMLTGFIAVIILIAVLSIFSTYYSDKRNSTSEMVKHTNDVLSEAEQILLLTKDIDIESRGYVITGDSNYLRYFTIAKNDIFTHDKKIKELTKDNPSQQVRVASLSGLIAKQIGFALICFEAANNKNFETPKEAMPSLHDRFYTDAIRTVTLAIQQEENNLLIQRQNEHTRSLVSFNRAFFVLLGSIFILLIIIFLSIRRNIAVRKKAEERIKESEHVFSTLFYKSPVLNAIIEQSTGKFIEVNDAFVNFWGDTKEDILEKTIIEINMLGNPEDSGQIIKNIQKDGLVRELEMQLDSSDGKASWISTNVDMVNLNGKDCFLSAGIDITKRKIAEENLLTLSQELEAIVLERTGELISSEKSYRYLFENNPMPMWVIDVNTFKFLDINEMAILQYGYSREEFLSMTTLDIRPDEDKELFKEPGHLLEMNSTRYSKGIWNHRKKDGTIMQVEISAHQIIFEGKPARFILSNDVTEKKKAEEKLDKSEKLFRAMIEKDADMKILATPEGEVFYASPSITKILGYETQEFMTILSFDLIHPGDVPGLVEGVTDIIQTPGKSFYCQQRLKHKNGSWLWCEGTITNMLHEPAVVALVSNFRDITERKKLEEQQALYSSIINSSDDAIFSKSLDGEITSWNHGAEKVFGYPSKEIMGKHISTIVPAYLQGEEVEIMKKIHQGESVVHYETERIRKDGTIISVSITISPIRDSLGKITGASKISRDISERKKAEESLRLAEANYREIFDKASDAIYVHEIETGRVIEVNQRASIITGYTREELLNGDPRELMTDNPDYTLQHAMNHLQKAASGEPQLFDWMGKNKDGAVNWLEVNLKKASIAGKVRILAFFREINDRKKAQFELQKLHEELEQKIADRTEQLETANKELEAFSYSVSHDLRAPLRAINGFAKMIGENYGSAFDNEAKRLFSRITVNAIKMGLLIDNLLEFSRLGKKEIHKSPIRMTELAKATLLEINSTINHEAAVKIHKLHSANADSTMIKQVMINLLSNAIKYSSKTEKPVIVIKSYLEENEIIYSVSDNGVGFNNQFVHKLFGVFQRLHLKTDFEGTGVGLALVKRIINKHGGRVWAVGELNKGATFCFSLPKTNNN